ncbi:MAG TPA: hypothetical protein VN193_02455 [Candidatus Angelobacter sp.]|nr:hypothetical protein [Candidatus Angelobacter sp.]
MLATLSVAVAAAFSGGGAAASSPHVLRVGTVNGVKGPYASIQAAVNDARPGDWVLVGPGDYHEQGVPGSEHQAGVLITTPGVHLRGMNRNTVVVDGTKPGSPQCDAAPSSQNLGLPDGSGGTLGRNGVEVWEADGVSVENLLVCNFLSGSGGGNGNQIWWNGGDGTGTINLHALRGDYITASSSYDYGTDPANHASSTVPMGQYGIFTSNEGGPGVIDHSYASNMGDSDYYIGACQDCNVDLNHAHAENSALGFSGTNAGGHLTIENGEWDRNKTGIAPNTLNNDDWPSPANGACPGGGGSCSVIRNNNVHDNNNPNTPGYGIAAAAPVGVGIILSGIRNYTVTGNTVTGNNGWGVVVNDYPDGETPSPKSKQPCAGGTDLSTPAQSMCYYQAVGNEVAANTFSNNASWNNPGNADIALAAQPSAPANGDCFHGNTDTSGTLSSDPPQIQTLLGMCGIPNQGYLGPSFAQLVCASPGALPLIPQCPQVPPVVNYPQGSVADTTILPIPYDQATMPDPCKDVPANPWCPSTTAVVGASAGDATPAASLPDTAGVVAAPASAGLLAAFATLGGVVVLRRRRGGAGR